MARKRSALAAAGFVQCRMRIPASFHARLQNLKRQHRMRGLDSTVSAMIRKAMAHYAPDQLLVPPPPPDRSEEHTSELQSLMRISYAVFCLKKKRKTKTKHTNNVHT